MYKRIILAYDGTLHGRTALREGALLAKRCGAQVFVLSVVAESAGTRLAQGAGGVGGTLQHDNYRAILDDGLARLRRLGFEPQGHLAVGEPSREIGAYANRIGADLVVVGHSQQTALARWWSGPTGAHLIDFIRCSLLISRSVIGDAEFEALVFAAAPLPGPPVTSPAAGAPAPLPASSPAAPPESAPPTPGVTAASGPAAPPPARRRLRFVLFLLLPVALIGALIWYVLGGSTVSIDDAYVEADKVGVSTDVSGIVREVRVSENEHVAAGQVLFVLDDLQFKYALARAEAGVATVRDELNAQKASYRDMQAQIKEAQSDIGYYRTEYGRQEDLLKVHVASAANRDAARKSLENAEQRLASLRQQLAAIAANLNEQPTGPVEDSPRYRDAVAQRDEAARELAHTVVTAPFAGVVTDVPSTTPGRYLAAATTAFYLVSTDHVWVQANPKETAITYVRPGQAATVHVDTYPNVAWRGTVASVSPAAAEEFSLLPAQNTSGNWVKVVQRVPMRIRLDTGDQSLPPLGAGMSAEVEVDTGHARGWPHFLTGSNTARAETR